MKSTAVVNTVGTGSNRVTRKSESASPIAVVRTLITQNDAVGSGTRFCTAVASLIGRRPSVRRARGLIGRLAPLAGDVALSEGADDDREDRDEDDDDHQRVELCATSGMPPRSTPTTVNPHAQEIAPMRLNSRNRR